MIGGLQDGEDDVGIPLLKILILWVFAYEAYLRFSATAVLDKSKSE